MLDWQGQNWAALYSSLQQETEGCGIVIVAYESHGWRVADLQYAA